MVDREMGDWIHLSSFEFPCIIGLLEHEQRVPQPVAIELSLGLDLEGAVEGSLAKSVDYVPILEQVQFIAQHGRWRLLESAAGAIIRFILCFSGYGQPVSTVRLKISKPTVFGGRAIPSIEMTRSRSSLDLRTLEANEIQTTVLLQTPQSGAYQLRLAPGATWPAPAGAAIFVAMGAVDGASCSHATGSALARGQESALHNRMDEPAVLLVVAQPPLAS